ncbi:Nucleotide-sugar putative transporter 2-like protein [Drosera capensis]
MLDLFVSRKIKKILKRKDSDAGQRGKALENLRGSLFNELRSSEGARHQQQRLCVPTVALTFNFLVAVAIILTNKLVVALCSFHRCCSGYVNDLQFHFFGACIALAWIVPSAVNKILWSNMQQQEKWTAPALMWKTTPITLFFLVMMMPWLFPPGQHLLLLMLFLANSKPELLSLEVTFFSAPIQEEWLMAR